MKDFKSKLHLIFTTVMIVVSISIATFSEVESQEIQNTAKEITVSGNARAFLSSNTASIKVEIEGNGASAETAEKSLNTEISKLKSQKDVSIIVQQKQFLGASSKPNELVKGSPVKATATLLLVCKNLTLVPSLIDQVMNIQSAKVANVSYFPIEPNALKEAYAAAVANAKSKAEYLTNSNGLKLGEILEINTTEELPPSSIREQISLNPEAIDSGVSEINVFATVKFSLLKSQ